MPARRPASAPAAGAQRAAPVAAPAPPADDGPPARPDDLVVVGRIVDAYGLRGWVKLAAFNDPADSVLLRARRWWLGASGASVRIERARVQGASVVARLAGVADRDAALALRGAEVAVRRADFPPPADGEFYWVDLIGCAVVDRAGRLLGEVARIDDHGAHPLLAVRPPPVAGAVAPPEFLIPFVSAWVDGVDTVARVVRVDWDPDA